MIKALSTLVAAILFAALKTPCPSTETPNAQQKMPDAGTIKSDVALVLVPALVIDRAGRYIPDLTRSSFHIYEDGVEQEIDQFDSQEAPFSVVLMMDTSGSTRFKLIDIQLAAVAFVDALREQDQVMVVSFENLVYLDSLFTANRRALRRAIFQTATGSFTRLYDAMDLVISERLKDTRGRKAIVLFTDGVDTASESASAYGTLRLAEGANLLVYPIQYDTQTDFRSTTRTRADSRHPQAASPASDLRNEAYEQAERYLRSLADRTGARHSRAATIIDVNQCFALIADELRHQYTLSYYSTNTARNGTYRSIRVSVDRPDAAVRARHGYRAAYN